MIQIKQVRLTQQHFSLFFIVLAIGIGALAGLFVLSVASPLKILAVLLAIALAAAAFIRIEYGLLALVFLTYINFFDVAARKGIPSLAPALIVLLIGTILFHALFRSETPRGWLRPVLLMFTFSIAALISFAYARDIGRTEQAFFNFLMAAMLASLVVMLLQNAKFLRHVIWVLIVAGLFMSGISIFQYFNNAWAHDFGGFGRAEISQITATATVFRIAGPIGDANFYAQILVVLLPLSIERAWYSKKRIHRLIATTASAITALAVFLTFSRGGFLALLLTLLLTFLWIRPKFKHVILALACSIPLLAFIPRVYFERISTISELLPSSGDSSYSDRAFRGRASEWKAALLMFQDHPFFGVGLGNYPVHYQQYSRDIGLDPRLSNRSAHSLYLQVAAETGLLGITLLALILLQALRGTLAARKRLLAAGMQEAASLTSAFLIGFLGYLFAGIFLHPAYPNFLWMLIGIALALPAVAANELVIREEELKLKKI